MNTITSFYVCKVAVRANALSINCFSVFSLKFSPCSDLNFSNSSVH